MLLPADLITRVLAFLPVVDSAARKRACAIRKEYVRRELVAAYRARWGGAYAENHDDWLANDIGRWLNDDIALLRLITPRYQHIVALAFGVTDPTFCDLDVFQLERSVSSRALVVRYFAHLSEREVREARTFCLCGDCG